MPRNEPFLRFRQGLQSPLSTSKLPAMLVRLIILVFLAVAPTSAVSDVVTVRDRIVRELREDGYGEIRMSRTLLGRIRFVASDRERRREIVVTKTGIILRDYVRFLGNSGSGSSGNEPDEDDEDDDDENDDSENDDEENDDEEDNDDDESDDDNDDDESDDNSGSGSSNSGSSNDSDDDESDDNSGSGSSNSGSGSDDDEDDD